MMPVLFILEIQQIFLHLLLFAQTDSEVKLLFFDLSS